MSEEWKPVVGYEGFYSVSSKGRVRSEPRITLSVDGRTFRHRGFLLRPGRNSSGRFGENLCRDGVQVSRLIHRLVAESFIPNPEGHPFVLHWDDNPENNQVSNLRWGTRSENTHDSIRNGIYWRNRKGQKKDG